MIQKQILKDHIRGLNKFLTPEFLDTLSCEHLLRLAHPLYRSDHARLLHKEGLIDNDILRSFVKMF
jgi:hypothetical protein